MTSLSFHQFSCLSDNYGVLVHSDVTGETASIDAPDGEVVDAALTETGWNLTHIFVTHHHADHIQGIPLLKKKYGCRVIGPANPQIADLDETYGDSDTFVFAGEQVEVIATPGHTMDMVNYYLPGPGVLFAGDTLFAMGCGRVFEGTKQQMWQSLEKLMQLPPETIIYCGHEYTLSNARFALTVDGSNKALKARAAKVEKLREAGKPTIPTTLAIELETNPFLRAADPQLREEINMKDARNDAVFTEIRTRKDNA